MHNMPFECGGHLRKDNFLFLGGFLGPGWPWLAGLAGLAGWPGWPGWLAWLPAACLQMSPDAYRCLQMHPDA